jgi:hypothetical protein
VKRRANLAGGSCSPPALDYFGAPSPEREQLGRDRILALIKVAAAAADRHPRLRAIPIQFDGRNYWVGHTTLRMMVFDASGRPVASALV